MPVTLFVSKMTDNLLWWKYFFGKDPWKGEMQLKEVGEITNGL